MQQKSRLTKIFIALAAAITLVASLSSLYSRTAAQKEPTIHDTFVRVAHNVVRLKPGFVAEKKGKTGIVVYKASTHRVVGMFGCGVCPGGDCESGIIRRDGSLSCIGCGSNNNKDCTLDPFEP
jgi:hypothetical protein